ncbi:MAG: transglycosylase domain-containing protein [Loktanella sp.]|nr:transglycosylase domain-containing protein [Loktanella sp.]
MNLSSSLAKKWTTYHGIRVSLAAILTCLSFQAHAQSHPNANAGIYTMTRLLISGMGALTPVSDEDKPGANILQRAVFQRSGFHARYQMATGEIREIGSARNTRTNINDIPDIFIAALLVTEDNRFFEHPGADPIGTARAFTQYLGGSTRGASGITQQLIKNQIVGSDLTFARKAIEATLAIQLESLLDKDEILQAYLGVVWFGRGWGAASAAQSWFGKDWDDLSLSEQAFLAGILQGPALYDPERHPERAHARRDHVLARMLATDVISQADFDQARSERLMTIPVQSGLGRHEWSDVTVERWIEANSAMAGILQPEGISERLPMIETSLDQRWQSLAQSALRSQIEEFSLFEGINNISADDLEIVRMRAGNSQSLPSNTWRSVMRAMGADERVLPAVLLGGDNVAIARGWGMNSGWVTEQRSILPGLRPGDVVLIDRESNGIVTSREVEGAVVVMNIHTGEILASIGGNDVRISRFDRTMALRQPGSAAKSFVYLAALEAGWRPTDLIDDARAVFEGGYSPQNFRGQQYGIMPIYTAFENSSNVAAVKLANQIGIRWVSEVATRTGAYPDEMEPYLSSALGASETTLRDLVTGYASIGNGGFPVSPILVSTIADRDGQVWAIRPGAEQFGFSDHAIVGMHSLMRGVVTRGTAAQAFRNSPVHVIGKTGTSQGNRDALFVGMGADIAVGVWIGRDDSAATNTLLGGTHAAPVAARIFREAFEIGLINEYGHDAEESALRLWPPMAVGDTQDVPVGGWISFATPP